MQTASPFFLALPLGTAPLLCGVHRGLLVVMLLLLPACAEQQQAEPLLDGDAKRGRMLVSRYGCTACHTIGEAQGLRGIVGPPLTGFAGRAYVAGTYPNDPETVIRWIQNPPLLQPDTAMPNMDISRSDAMDIAAFLYTLR